MKKIIILLSIFYSICRAAFSTTGIIDDFNREAVGDDYTVPSGTIAISGNQLHSMTDDPTPAIWNVATYGPDVEAYFTLPTKPVNGSYIEIFCRLDGSFNGYFVMLAALSGTDKFYIKRVAGGVTVTNLDSAEVEFTAGEKLGISAIGTSIKAHHYTSGAWSQVVSVTDATYSNAGSIALEFEDGTARVDDLGGGTVSCTDPTFTPISDIDDSVHRDGGINIVWAGDTADIDSIQLLGTQLDSIKIIRRDSLHWVSTKILSSDEDTFRIVYWSCAGEDAFDTILIAATFIWDSLRVDSAFVESEKLTDNDSIYDNDTLDLYVYNKGTREWTVPYLFDKEDSSETHLKIIVKTIHDSLWDTGYIAIGDSVSTDTLNIPLIYAGAVPAPSVTTNPVSNTVSVGDPFAIFIDYDIPPRGTNSFQWEIDSGDGWEGYTGKTDSTLMIANATYAMDGWQLRCIVTNSRSGPDTSTVAVLDVIAKFTLTYNGNGNSGGSPPTDANAYEENDEVTTLGNTGSLVKTGYTFSTWNTAANGSGTNRAPAGTWNIGAANVTLYAQWVIKTYAVMYNANGGSGTMTDNNSPYDSNSTVTVLSNSFTRVGYNFDSFNTAANGSGTEYAPAATFDIAGNITLYAQWNIKTYTIDSTIVNGLPDSIVFSDYGTVDSNTVITVTLGTPVDSQWTVSGDTSGIMTELAFTVKENWTLTFTLDEIPLVTYTLTVTDDGHGSTVPAGAQVVGQGLGTSVVATDDIGYNFVNWTVTAGSAAFNNASAASAYCTLSTGNATIRANFTAIQYTATVTIVGGGHVDASPGLTVDSGATITLTAVPGVDSVFVGWSGGITSVTNPLPIIMILDTATTATFEYSPRSPATLSRWAQWIRPWIRMWR
ncbi:MAG: InlB B-repeat-containing protein [Candidatus Marinimicrobia bacterium]|nr:InlB B-repeat-containing protein [Candidatus Neomarinimicrobiota bacterium]